MATIRKRTTSNNDVSYQVKVRLKGHPAQCATFTRKTDALKWAAATESAIREGRYFQTVESKKHTGADLIDRYIKSVLPTKGSQRLTQELQLKWWREAIGAYRLSDITPALLAECRDRLAADKAPTNVNRNLAVLSHAFTIAMKEWGGLTATRCAKSAS